MKSHAISQWRNAHLRKHPFRAFASIQPLPESPPLHIPYSDFISQLRTNEILQADFRLNDPHVRILRANGQIEETIVPTPVMGQTMTALIEKDVLVNVSESDIALHDVSTILLWIIQFAVFIGIGRMILNANGRNSMNSFSQMKEKGGVQETGVTFDDIAGADAAKQDLQEVVDFLKHPETYTQLGAKIPKGILLYGPSGTGKTTLAKGVAGEAGVPFFACSGSEFVEMFVGVGSSRIRNLFEQAQKAAPCIVFIDEIDAVGRRRSGGDGNMGGSTEHDQTINQLLTCMDGFNENQGIIVMGATNRVDVLDDALLRPGRFDRRILVELPDRVGRSGILKIHTKGKPVSANVSLESLSKRTAGFSGADLESLCNEAAIYAAREKDKEIQTRHFDMAFEKLTMGEERRTTYVSEAKKRVLAIHEAGHALMGMLVDLPDKVHKVSIVPRGMSGGATYFEPNEDQDIGLQTREYLEHHIMVALGGRAAEEITFGKKFITTGASGDLAEVYRTAYDMIAEYGFSQSMGPVCWSDAQGLQSDIDMEIKELVELLYTRTLELLFTYQTQLDELARILQEKETLDFAFLQDFQAKVAEDRIILLSQDSDID
jgi:cell division protease FtsH